MMGPSLAAMGGISSVANVYKEEGFFDAQNVTYISTYDDRSALKKITSFATSVLKLLQELVVHDVALVHIHSASRKSFFRKAIIAMLVRLLRTPTIFHIHSGEFPTFYTNECNALGRWVVRNTLKRSTRVVSLTRHGRDQLLEILRLDHNVITMPNPISLDTVSHANIERADLRFRILHLSGLTSKKGIFDLLKAVRLVYKSGIDIHLTCAGLGEVGPFNQACKELDLESRVDYVGWVSGEAKALEMRKADILVLPSYFEGQPMVILEAMAAELPIVATNIGGIPDTVTDRVDALLYEPGDVDELASVITEMATNEVLRRSLTEAALRRVAEDYSSGVVLKKLTSLYDDLRSEK
jgi:glycosyltransferase involved in cell wall biosynthesis